MAPRKKKATPKISNSKKEIAHELHKPARRRFLRRHIGLHGFKDLFQADLIDLRLHSGNNRGYKYILIVICCFSKYVFARPLKTKKGQEVADAMRSILSSKEKKFLKPPKFLHVDQGSEFYSPEFEQVMNDLKIEMYSTWSTTKACIAERVIRTIKGIMFREFSVRGSYNWVNILDIIIKRYNNSHHRTIHMVPAKVSTKDENYLQNIHSINHANRKRGKEKFKVGDIVRISKIKSIFQKGYTPSWSTELFEIIEVCKTCPVTYKLKDSHGQIIMGGFYNEELQKTSHQGEFLVEKVLKKKGNMHYVKFLGFPNSENAWINVSNYV